MKRFVINKKLFKKLLIRKYGSFIKDRRYTNRRLYTMLACECDVQLRTIYNFTSATFSTKLLKKIVNVLNISKEEYQQLIYLKEETAEEQAERQKIIDEFNDAR